MVQINPRLGALATNCAAVEAARMSAAADGADLAACAEFSVTGAPLHDLPRHGAFLDAVEAAVAGMAAGTADGGPALLVGAPWRDGDRVHDAMLLLDGGRVAEVRHAQHPAPPFVPGAGAGPVAVRGVPLGLLIGGDLDDPDCAETLRETGAEILLAPCASPWLTGMADLRLNLAVARVTEAGLPLAWVNLLGGQDEAVFDGGAFVLNADRGLAVQDAAFRPNVTAALFRRDATGWRCDTGALEAPPESEAAIYRALMMSLADWLAKGGGQAVATAPQDEDRGSRPRTGLAAAMLAALAVDVLGPAGLCDRPGAGVRSLADCTKTDLALGRAGMTGDFAPLRDLWEGEVYRLARWRNRHCPPEALGAAGGVVSESLLAEPPDLDRDAALSALLSGEAVPPAGTASDMAAALFAAEALRRRAPPGPRLSRTAFGRDRRYPLTCHFPEE